MADTQGSDSSQNENDFGFGASLETEQDHIVATAMATMASALFPNRHLSDLRVFRREDALTSDPGDVRWASAGVGFESVTPWESEIDDDLDRFDLKLLNGALNDAEAKLCMMYRLLAVVLARKGPVALSPEEYKQVAGSWRLDLDLMMHYAWTTDGQRQAQFFVEKQKGDQSA